jgi:hypothetical protein
MTSGKENKARCSRRPLRAYPDDPISKRPDTEIPPPAVPRLAAPFGKGGGEGAAERGSCSTGQSYEGESYWDRH